MRNRNRKLQTSKAPLKSQAQGTSLFTSAASNQWGLPKNSPWEAQVRYPEDERIVIVIVISKLLKRYSKAQGTSLFTSAATNQRGVSKGGSREAQVRIPEYQEGTE